MALVIGLLCALAGAVAARAQDGHRVLLISTFHGELPFAQDVERGLRQALARDGSRNNLFVEYLDAARFPGMAHDQTLINLMADKYVDTEIDTVIVWAATAARFVDRWWGVLNPKRLVAIELNESNFAISRARAPDAVKIKSDVTYEAGLRVALDAVRPTTFHLIGESLGTTGAMRHRQALAAWEALAPKARLVDLFDRPLGDVLATVSTAPEGSLIYYTPVFHDEHGRGAVPREIAQRVAATANAPVFTGWESLMAGGVVGGHLLSGARMGEIAGAMALALARDETDAVRALSQADIHIDSFDAQALSRWNIQPSHLPADAQIINQDQIPWPSLRPWIIAVCLVVATLTALAFALARAKRTRDRLVLALADQKASLARTVEERTAELARSNAELEGFAYAISHDLRAPLRAITGFSRLLKSMTAGRLSAEEDEAMAVISSHAVAMDGMIHGLLDYARVGHGGAEQWTVLALDQLARRVIDELHVEMSDPDAAVGLAVAGPIPPIRGHAMNLERLFQNLIENALKYRHPDRPPVVMVRMVVSAAGVRVDVADNGIGVPENQRERIFGLFQRLNRGRDAGTVEGHGVGLALCRRIVEAHGGEISVMSIVGQGATFSVILPINQDTVASSVTGEVVGAG